MRSGRLAVVVVLGAGSLIAVACGLEQGGLLVDPGDASVDSGSGDAIVVDVSIPDIFVPPPCKTLDTSCLPAFPDDAGWKPVLRSPDTTCPPDPGWVAATFVADASLNAASCGTCGCSLNVPSCAPEGGLALWAGNNFNCGGNPISTITLPANTCVDQGSNLGRSIAQYPATTATTCDAGGGGGDAQVFTTPVNLCATSECRVPFCAEKDAGFGLCIVNELGDVPCPAGYVKTAAGKAAGGSCGTCGCAVTAQARCNASVQTFQNTGCDTIVDTINVDSGCKGINNFNAAKLTVTQTDASCTATASGVGAALAGKVTICCAN